MAVEHFDDTALGNGPVRRTGTTSTAAPSSPIKSKGQPKRPDSYDGRANTNAGTPAEKKLEVEGPGRVIRTGR